MIEPDWNKVVDDILASEQAQEWVEPEREGKFGLDEYYFSEHSLALAILEQFEWEEEFFKQHPKLKIYLDKELRDWLKDQPHDDPDIFMDWFLGNKITCHPDAYVEVIDKTLMKEYRKRITETHNCSRCGAEISEAYPWGHEQHILRVGVEQIDDDEWRHELFCKKCFEARLKR